MGAQAFIHIEVLLAGARKCCGMINMDHLITKTGRRVETEKMRHSPCSKPCLLLQLTDGRVLRFLVLLNESGGEFPHGLSRRVTVLFNQNDVFIVRTGHHSYRARM